MQIKYGVNLQKHLIQYHKYLSTYSVIKLGSVIMKRKQSTKRTLKIQQLIYLRSWYGTEKEKKCQMTL